MEIAKKETNEVTIASGNWGAGSNVDSEDLVIAKMLLIQPQSRQVAKKLAAMGEFRGSLDNKLYGDNEKGFEAVIFDKTKVWICYEDKKWKRTISVTPENAAWDWKENINGVEIERQKAINLFTLPIIDGKIASMPLIIRLKGKSFATAKRLLTMFRDMAQSQKPSAAKVIRFKAFQDENEKGIFYVWDFEEVRDSSSAELSLAFQWWKSLQSIGANVKVDESDVSEETVGEAAATTATEVNDADLPDFENI